MTDTNDDAPSLHSLAGRAAPREMAGHLARIAALPEGAKRELWRVLGPSLSEPVSKDVERALDTFAHRHALSMDDLAPVIRAARFLLRNAARHGLDQRAFLDDVDALTGGDAGVRELLASGFAPAFAQLRREMIGQTFADHGKAVEACHWKMERVVASDRAEGIDASVASLTFRYVEGGTRGSVTLLVPPEVLRELRDACDRMLGAGGRAPARGPA